MFEDEVSVKEVKMKFITDDACGRIKNRFTLIELLVTTAQQNCFSKLKNDTSSRPSGRTSRLTQSSSSHLHTPKAFFTQSAFTLIELLVVIAIIAILAAGRSSGVC